MSDTKRSYLYILIFGLFLLGLGFGYNIGIIKSLYYNTIATVSKPLVLVPAVLCAFIFLKSGYYWLIMIICALGDAFAYHFLAGKTVYSFGPLAMTAFAFLVIVYFLNFARAIIKD